MKRLFSFMFIVILLFVLPVSSAFATESLPSTDADGTADIPASDGGETDSGLPAETDDTGSVITYTTPDAFSGSFEMTCGDTGFTQLHSALDSVSISGTAEKDGLSTPIALSVAWDFSTVDAEMPGSYTASGRIVLPEGAVLAEGLAETVSVAVLVSAPILTVTPAAITLTGFDEPYRTDAAAFAIGTSQEVLDDWFAATVAGFYGYDAEGNYYDLISGEWNLNTVNTASAGVYESWISPDLGTEYVLAEGVSLPRQLCAVSIQIPGQPDINVCVAGRGFLHFPWVLSAEQEEQLDTFSVWLQQDNGEWTELSEGFLIVSDGLQLSQRIFTSGSSYALKVTYPGGETGVLSFQYDGELSILDYSGGDRDGGDAGGNEPPVGSQPAPTSPPSGDTNGGGSHDDNEDSSSGNEASPTPVSSEPSGSDNEGGDTSEETESPATQEPVTAPPTQTTDTPVESSDEEDEDDALATQDTTPYSPAQTSRTETPADTVPAVPTPSAIPVMADISSHSPEAPITDAKGTGLSDAEIPSENPSSEPEASTEVGDTTGVYESYSSGKTVISGLRLRDLCAQEENIVFGSGSLTVSIPGSLLSALNLSDSDTLTVILTQPENGQILFAVEAAGTAVTELPESVIRLRWSPESENARLTVQNEAGEPVADATYTDGLLRFTAAAAGTYTLMEISEETGGKEGLSPLLPVTGSLLLATGGFTFFRRKRHG